jgi:hypothetical protein
MLKAGPEYPGFLLSGELGFAPASIAAIEQDKQFGHTSAEDSFGAAVF